MRNVEFDPGDGWREVDPAPSREQRLALITNGVIDRMWAPPKTPTRGDNVNHADCCTRLAKIAALDTFDVSVWGEPGSPFANGAAAMLSRVRAVLAEPGPAVPAHDADRDAATERLLTLIAERGGETEAEDYLAAEVRRLRALARPVLAHDIDRDALVDVAQDAITAIDGPATIGSRAAAAAAVDAILALVRPVEGVVLSREEREKLAYLVEHATYSGTIDVFVSEWFEEHAEDLKVRLEGAGS